MGLGKAPLGIHSLQLQPAGALCSVHRGGLQALWPAGVCRRQTPMSFTESHRRGQGCETRLLQTGFGKRISTSSNDSLVKDQGCFQAVRTFKGISLRHHQKMLIGICGSKSSSPCLWSLPKTYTANRYLLRQGHCSSVFGGPPRLQTCLCRSKHTKGASGTSKRPRG